MSVQWKMLPGFPKLLVLGLGASVVLASIPSDSMRGRAAEPNWPERLEYRMVLLGETSLSNDGELESVKEQLRRAAVNGYNSAVLAADARLIQPQTAGSEYLSRLRSLCDEANRVGIGLVPSVMPFDADISQLHLDPNLAEGLPVRDVLYVVEGDRAHLRPDPPITLINSGFETRGENGIPGWQLVGLQPGRDIMIDTNHAFYGNSSLQFENLAEEAQELSYRATQQLRLPPFRLFRVSVWVRSEDPDGDTSFYLAAHAKGRLLGLRYLDPGNVGEWRRHELVFDSLYGGETELQLAVFDAKSRLHKIWFDNLEIEHVGLLNVLRRPGCPLTVRNERGRAYEERRDYEIVAGAGRIAPPGSDSTDTSGGPFLRLTPSTRIRDGERLRVSFFAAPSCPSYPASLCPNSDGVFERFGAGIRILRKTLMPFGYHLATKYVSTANWDEACVRTKKTPGAQWGECLRRQITILGGSNQQPVCFVWSDMYEPWNNPYSQFWVCNGTFVDAWRYLPKDCVVLNAHYASDESRSPQFFAANGYVQVIAGDAMVGKWMQDAAGIPGIVGVMNTAAPLDEFATKAWGWLPQELRVKLPSRPNPAKHRQADALTDSPSDSTTSKDSPREIRTWTDASGRHTVDASYIGAKSGIVTLQKRDGTQITIPYEALSEEDRRWVFRQVGETTTAEKPR